METGMCAHGDHVHPMKHTFLKFLPPLHLSSMSSPSLDPSLSSWSIINQPEPTPGAPRHLSPLDWKNKTVRKRERESERGEREEAGFHLSPSISIPGQLHSAGMDHNLGRCNCWSGGWALREEVSIMFLQSTPPCTPAWPSFPASSPLHLFLSVFVISSLIHLFSLFFSSIYKDSQGKSRSLLIPCASSRVCAPTTPSCSICAPLDLHLRLGLFPASDSDSSSHPLQVEPSVLLPVSEFPHLVHI